MSVKRYVPRPVEHVPFEAARFDGTAESAAEIIKWLGEDPGGFAYGQVGQPVKGGGVGLFVFIERTPFECLASSYVIRVAGKRSPERPMGFDKFEERFVEVPDDPDVAG